MDKSGLINLNMLDLKLPNFSELKQPIMPIRPNIYEKFENDQRERMRIIENIHEKREEREEENRINLRIATENTSVVIRKLEEQILQKDEDLRNQRDLIKMLNQQLTGVNRVLSDLFILQEEGLEVQEEVKMLANEIYRQMLLGKKIDWKSIVIDKGIDITLAAIPIILQFAKILL